MTKSEVTFSVAEVFVSLNGEGPRAGKRAAFLRFVGCNLACSWCDTQWACEGVDTLGVKTLEELVAYVEAADVAYVTITGGEPLLQDNLGELIVALSQIPAVQAVEIETNGSVDIRPLHALRQSTLAAKDYSQMLGAELVFTLDYKLPSSAMEHYMLTEHYDALISQDTVKFVVGSVEDFDKMVQVVDSYSLTSRCQVYVSPVFGAIEVSWLAEELLRRRLNGYTMQLQLHKLIWPKTDKGV